MSPPGHASGRRAPRLGARSYLAPHLRRSGRFAAVDPLRGRPLPSLPALIGGFSWVVFLGACLAQAWRRTRAAEDPAAR